MTLVALPGPVVETDGSPSPLDRVRKLTRNAYLGFGITRPFRRDHRTDFVNAGGEDLVRASVGQILGTRASSDLAQGEIPWNTELGSLLHLLRHMPNNIVLRELGRVRVVEALARWEPRVVVKGVTITNESTPGGGANVLSIRLRYDIIAANVPGNQVLVSDVTQDVTV